MVGELHQSGLFLQQDYRKAIFLFTLSADQGHPMGQLNLGINTGMQTNPELGISLIQRAADQDLLRARSYLAWCMYNGDGVPKDCETALKLLQEGIDREDNLARFYYGFILSTRNSESETPPEDQSRAIELYTLAAAGGHLGANYHLALEYLIGRWVEPDPQKAKDLLHTAVYGGHSRAMFRLGVMYVDGEAGEKDESTGLDLIEEAANRGVGDACTRMGWYYSNGIEKPLNPIRAMRYFITAANQGDPTAQFELGRMREEGIGVDQDYAQAASLYLLAAKQGYPRAQLSLGRLYATGKGVEKDEQMALDLYRAAADQDLDVAMHMLGAFYYRGGETIAKDIHQAIFYFQKAIAKGNLVFSILNLAFIYLLGDTGVEMDEAKAAVLFKQAADSGNDSGQFNLGVLYLEGRGVEQSDRMAATLFSLAAMQGKHGSELNLGLMYKLGKGMPLDFAKAASWLTKATNQGNERAGVYLAQLSSTTAD